MKSKNIFVGFRASPEWRKRVQAEADKEHRTLSQMIILLVGEALKDRQCREMIRKAERETPADLRENSRNQFRGTPTERGNNE